MAMAQITEIGDGKLPDRSAKLGEFLISELQTLTHPELQITARGLGLMAGLELRLANGDPAGEAAMCVIKTLLHRGFILLPEGEHGNVISFTPPLTITKAQLVSLVEELKKVLSEG